MGNNSKLITLHLKDGHSKGVVRGWIENHSLIFIRIPITRLEELQEELKSPGVYILSNTQDSSITQIYIGEAEDILKRLKTHLSDKYKDEELLEVFIIKSAIPNNPLEKGHIRYIENRLIKIADASNIDVLDNKTSPKNLSPLSDAHADVMESYIEDIITVLPAMGLDLSKGTKDTTEPRKPIVSKSPIFLIRSPKKKIIARLQEENGKFIILEGSEADNETQDSMPDSSKRFRDYLLKHNLLELKDGKLIFTRNIEFNSPSAAASVVLGISVSGNHYWLEEQTKQTIGQWLSNKI